jgi:hypothetical protein
MKFLSTFFVLLLSISVSYGQDVTLEISSETNANVEVSIQTHPMLESEVLANQQVEKGKATLSFSYGNDSYASLNVNGVSKVIFFELGKTYGIEVLPDGKFKFTKNGALNTTLANVDETYGKYRYHNKLYYDWETEEFADGISELRNYISGSLSNRTQKLSNFEEQVLEEFVAYQFTAQILNFYWANHRPGHPKIEKVTNPDFFNTEISRVAFDDAIVNRNLQAYQLSLKYYSYLKNDAVTSSMIDNGVKAVEPFLDSLYRLTDDVNYPPAVKSFLLIDVLQAVITTTIPANFTSYLNDYIVKYPESLYYDNLLKNTIKS